MLKSKNVRIMLVLMVVAFTYTFVLGNGGCDDTGTSAFIEGAETEIVGWGNDLADNIDSTCEDAGIPRMLSTEIYEEVTGK